MTSSPELTLPHFGAGLRFGPLDAQKNAASPKGSGVLFDGDT
jgi:hypothetical protein